MVDQATEPRISELERQCKALEEKLQYEQNAKIGVMHEFLRCIQDKIMTPENFAALYPDLAAGRLDLPKSYLVREEVKGTVADTIDNKVNIQKQKQFIVLFSGPIGSGKTDTKNHIVENYNYIMERVVYNLYAREKENVRKVFIEGIEAKKDEFKKQNKIIEEYRGIIETVSQNLHESMEEETKKIIISDIEAKISQVKKEIEDRKLDENTDIDEDLVAMYAKRRLFNCVLKENVDFKNKGKGNADFIIDTIEERVNSGFYDQHNGDMYLVAQLLAFAEKPILHAYKEVTDNLPHLKLFYSDPKRNAEKVQTYTCEGRIEIHVEIAEKEGVILLDRDIWEDYIVFVAIQKLYKQWDDLTEQNYLTRLRLACFGPDKKSIINVPDVVALFVAHDFETRYNRTMGRGGPELDAIIEDDKKNPNGFYQYIKNESDLYAVFTQLLKSGKLKVPYVPGIDPRKVADFNADADISGRPELRAEALALIIMHAAAYQQQMKNN